MKRGSDSGKCARARPLVAGRSVYGWVMSRPLRGARCAVCGAQRAVVRCDYPDDRKRDGQLCDRLLCGNCAQQRNAERPLVGYEAAVLLLCPAHAGAWDRAVHGED